MYSGAIGLSRFENEEYSSSFAIRGIHVFRAKNIFFFFFSMFVSPVIHGWYEFGRIAYHQYVIYAVHQWCDS